MPPYPHIPQGCLHTRIYSRVHRPAHTAGYTDLHIQQGGPYPHIQQGGPYPHIQRGVPTCTYSGVYRPAHTAGYTVPHIQRSTLSRTHSGEKGGYPHGGRREATRMVGGVLPGYAGKCTTRVCREGIYTRVYHTLPTPPWVYLHPSMLPAVPVLLHTEPSSAGRQSSGLNLENNMVKERHNAAFLSKSVKSGIQWCAELLRSS